jgi:hypothetical protein
LQFGVERALEGFAVLAERPVIDHRSRDARFAGALEPQSVGQVRYDEHDFRRIVFFPGPFDQRRHVGAAPGNENGDALLVHPAHRAKSRRPR